MSEQRRLFAPNAHSEWRVKRTPATCEEIALVEQVVARLQGGVARDVERIDEGVRSVNFFARTHTQGTTAETIYRLERFASREELERTATLMAYLSDRGLPVPPVVPVRATGAYTLEIDGALWQCYGFIRGDHFRGAPRELGQAARAIAAVHAALADYPRESDFPRTSHGTLDESEWNDAYARIEGTSVADLLRPSWHRLGALREHVCERLSRLIPLVQTLHADLHPLNLLYEREQLTAIIDFGNACNGNLGMDIGMACHRLVRQCVIHAALDASAAPVFADEFLQAYLEGNPRAQETVRELPTYMNELLLRKIGNWVTGYALKMRSEAATLVQLRNFLSLLDEVEYIHPTH